MWVCIKYKCLNAAKKLAATLEAIADVTGRVARAEWAAVERVLWVCAAALSNDVRLVTRLETRLKVQQISKINTKTSSIESFKLDLKHFHHKRMNLEIDVTYVHAVIDGLGLRKDVVVDRWGRFLFQTVAEFTTEA